MAVGNSVDEESSAISISIYSYKKQQRQRRRVVTWSFLINYTWSRGSTNFMLQGICSKSEGAWLTFLFLTPSINSMGQQDRSLPVIQHDDIYIRYATTLCYYYATRPTNNNHAANNHTTKRRTHHTACFSDHPDLKY